jgi:CelD/BcsL family acetyltransferase involved in cellulose biosynthesis
LVPREELIVETLRREDTMFRQWLVSAIEAHSTRSKDRILAFFKALYDRFASRAKAKCVKIASRNGIKQALLWLTGFSTIPALPSRVLTNVPQRFTSQRIKVRICRTATDLLRIRPLWEFLRMRGAYTVFQSFDLNLLAAARFAEREEPYVVCVENSSGAAIVPAVLRHRDNSIRLLGEELFDYRCFLHYGDEEVLRAALAALAPLERRLEILAMRESDRGDMAGVLQFLPFAAAPGVSGEQISAEKFALAHTRLARNLRRLERLGFELRSYDGNHAQLLRSTYTDKAAQRPASLFHDAERIEFLVSAAALMPDVFEIFTLEQGPLMAAALVTLRDGGYRRFYTGWFASEYEKHSPALALIYEVTRQSLAMGLNCDYMTGEQPYKQRLATRQVQLYRVCATPEELATLASRELLAAG